MTRLYKLLSIFTASSWLALFPMAAHADSSVKTFTWKKPAQVVTFNAITDNPAIGNEHNFLLVRPFASSDYSDNLKVTDGEEVVVMAYYDNDAATNYNLKAKNTRV